ncbi:pyridoxamine 5'-phosphate oxidase family protein [Candidatus Pacearchaeota archaeon]|nr:pyridoxamine 5'-phosphate oxidase family protein [Candidatus Pacearchaeota archaeon]
MYKMEEKFKKIIEENPVAFATINAKSEPHVIAVAFVKVKDNKIIITNNYMKSTVINLKKSPNVGLVVWDKKWNGIKIQGKAKYFEKGKWIDFIKSIPENKNEPCKGAIVVEINKICECI